MRPAPHLPIEPPCLLQLSPILPSGRQGAPTTGFWALDHSLLPLGFHTSLLEMGGGGGRGGLTLTAQVSGCQPLRSLEVKAQVPAMIGQVPAPPGAQEARPGPGFPLSPHRLPGPAGLFSRAHAISGQALPLHPDSFPAPATPAPGPAGNRLRSNEALCRESDPIRSRDGSGGRSRRSPRAGISSGVACWPEAQTRVGQSWPAPPEAQGRAMNFSGSWRSVVGERGPLGTKPPHSPGTESRGSQTFRVRAAGSLWRREAEANGRARAAPARSPGLAEGSRMKQ